MTVLWFFGCLILALVALIIWVLCCAAMAQISTEEDEDIHQ